MCEKMLVIGFGSTITQQQKVDCMYDITKKLRKQYFPQSFVYIIGLTPDVMMWKKKESFVQVWKQFYPKFK